MPEEQGGPFLQMAVLCEKVLREADGVLSLIRIVDRVTISGAGREMPQSPVRLTAAVAFKSGFAQGKYTVKLRPQRPSGKVLAELEFPLLFEGNERGAGIVADITLMVQEEGLYWIDVLLEDQVATRIPLRILYLRAGPAPPPET
jgi:hypothetical protein